MIRRTLIVLAITAAIIFVPYWVGNEFGIAMHLHDSTPEPLLTVLKWILGSLLMFTAFLAIAIVIKLTYKAVKLAYDYIKHG